MVTVTATLALCYVCAYLHLFIEASQQLCEVATTAPLPPSPKWNVRFKGKRNYQERASESSYHQVHKPSASKSTDVAFPRLTTHELSLLLATAASRYVCAGSHHCCPLTEFVLSFSPLFSASSSPPSLLDHPISIQIPHKALILNRPALAPV